MEHSRWRNTLRILNKLLDRELYKWDKGLILFKWWSITKEEFRLLFSPIPERLYKAYKKARGYILYHKTI